MPRAIPFDEIRRWLMEAALPLWAAKGVDRASGGFYEALNFSGAPGEAGVRRLRVACRQTYVFAHAAMLGWAEGAQLSKAGADFIASLYRGPDKGWPRLLSSTNAPLDPAPDLYDLAFVLFAFAWRHRLARDADSLAGAHRVVDFIEAHLRAPGGGFVHTLPAPDVRLQNPHMHLLEACLAAYEASGAARFLDLAREMAALFQARFFDGRSLGEAFDPDWRRREGGIEPGHHFEWAWILVQFARLAGAPAPEEARALVGFAEAHGVARDGAVVQSVRESGAALDSSSRSWPNTERIKGHLALFEAFGADPREAVAESARLLLDRYLATEIEGLWIDHFDASGAPIAANAPASTFYHIFLAFAEVLRLEEKLVALD